MQGTHRRPRGRRSNAGRLDEARAAYQRAIAATPDSAVLYRELGLVERQRGEPDGGAGAVRPRRRARSRRRDRAVAGGRDCSRSAGTSPAPRLRIARRIAPIRTPATTGRLTRPPRRRARRICPRSSARSRSRHANHARRSRGADRRPPGVGRLARRRSAAVVMTDTARPLGGSVDCARWPPPASCRRSTTTPFSRARRCGASILRRRSARAAASSRGRIRRCGPALPQRPTIADMSAVTSELPAVAAAVSSGVLPLVDGGRFDIERPVSGGEAMAADRSATRARGVRAVGPCAT